MNFDHVIREPHRAGLGMYWSVKDSFVRYIRSSRDGQIALAEGSAFVSTDNGGDVPTAEQFHFPLERFDQAGQELRLAFGGSVQFTAHFGMLNVTLRTPRLIIREDSAELAIADSGEGWLHLAHLELPRPQDDGITTLWGHSPTTLTTAGASLFDDTYAAGEVLAPITVRIPTTIQVAVDLKSRRA